MYSPEFMGYIINSKEPTSKESKRFKTLYKDNTVKSDIAKISNGARAFYNSQKGAFAGFKEAIRRYDTISKDTVHLTSFAASKPKKQSNVEGKIGTAIFAGMCLKDDGIKLLSDTFNKGKVPYAKTKKAKKLSGFLNKSLLDTHFARYFLKRFDSTFSSTVYKGRRRIRGTKRAVFAGKFLSRIPVLGLGILAVSQVPEVIRGITKGRGIAQTFKSAFNAASFASAGAFVGSVFAPLGPLASAVGMGLGWASTLFVRDRII